MKGVPTKLAVLCAVLTLAGPRRAAASQLTIQLAPDSGNPTSPQMGEHLSFHSTIRNMGPAPVDGLIGWISLIEVDRENEKPVDLEDWSAQKAVAASSLPAGQSIETDWPLRLIQTGQYRLVVSAMARRGTALTSSGISDFTVRSRPIITSRRVLPIALGVPALIGASLLLGRLRRRSVP